MMTDPNDEVFWLNLVDEAAGLARLKGSREDIIAAQEIRSNVLTAINEMLAKAPAPLTEKAMEAKRAIEQKIAGLAGITDSGFWIANRDGDSRGFLRVSDLIIRLNSK